MFKFGGKCLSVVMVLCGVAHTLCDVLMDEAWESWKTTFQKKYNGVNEESVRRAIWEKNMQLIKTHNKEYELGMHSYNLAMNHFSDMTLKEVAEKVMGLQTPMYRDPTNTYVPDDTMESLPKSIDYRDLGYVTPVKNQGSCNSCWAFSSAGALEGQLKKTTGKLVDLSPQNLVDCVNRSRGCQGGNRIFAFEYVKDNHGIDSEASYPYVGKTQPCAYSVSGKAAACKGYKQINQGNESELAAAVANVGPVSVGIDANQSTFQHYNYGVYYDPNCKKVSNHAVLIVGYGATLRGEKYWIVKNSWSETWGQKGYILMARDRGDACGIASRASFPLM